MSGTFPDDGQEAVNGAQLVSVQLAVTAVTQT